MSVLGLLVSFLGFLLCCASNYGLVYINLDVYTTMDYRLRQVSIGDFILQEFVIGDVVNKIWSCGLHAQLLGFLVVAYLGFTPFCIARM